MWTEILNKIEKNKNFRKHLTDRDLREIRADEANLRNRFSESVRNFNRQQAYSRPGNTPYNWVGERYANGTKNVGPNKKVTFSQSKSTFSIEIRKQKRPSGRTMNLEMAHNINKNTWTKRIEQYFETDNNVARVIQKARREQIRRRVNAFNKSPFAKSLPANIRRLVTKYVS